MMKTSFKTLFIGGLLLLSLDAHASLAGDNLPPVKNISALFGAKSATTQQQKNKILFSTTAKAADSARGTTAKEMAQMLAADIADYDQKAFVDAIADIRVNIETALQKHKFALQDLGVAYALCAVMLWEIANDHTLPEEASSKVMQQMIGSFDQIGEGYYQTSAADKAMFYDQLMATPMILLLMKEGYQQSNQADGVAEVRAAAATLFKNMTTLAHDEIFFSDLGEIRGGAQGNTATTQATSVNSAASGNSDW